MPAPSSTRPPTTVWAAIRDFNGLPGWHPGIADSAIEDGKAGDQVGAVRSMHLEDGGHLRERLLSFSDVDRHYSYNFEKTPFSVLNYHATLRVTPVTDGDRAFVEWWTTFDCEPEKIERVDRHLRRRRVQGRPGRAEGALRRLRRASAD